METLLIVVFFSAFLGFIISSLTMIKLIKSKKK